jgi:Chitinase
MKKPAAHRHMLRASLAALLLSTAVAAHADGRRALVGYYPSWFEATSGKLSATPTGYTHVILAFAKPDFAWNGQNWNGTGLQFASTPETIKKQIATLQARGIKVVLAVGGATYLNWVPLAAEADKPGKITAALTQFVADMGLDGIDVDYETDGTGPKQIAEYRAAIGALSNAANGKMLALAAWSTGADCTKATGTAACGGKTGVWDGRTGRERLVFAEASLFAKLSMINVMSYDAGVEEFDPVKAWSLYRALLPATVTLNIGFETAPEGWGPARLVATDDKAVCPGARIKADQFGNPVNKPYSVERILKDGPLSNHANPQDGAMVWHLLKDQKLPHCGHPVVVSPRELELTARVLLDRQRSASPAFSEDTDDH